MIIEWLVTVAAGASGWLGDIIPDWTPPDFLIGFSGLFNDLTANIGGLGVWADWGYIIGIVTVVISVWGITLLVRVARALGAHIPFFGGNG